MFQVTFVCIVHCKSKHPARIRPACAPVLCIVNVLSLITLED